MAERLSFDAYLGWVNISDPNNIPQDARVISADDLLRYETFGKEATEVINGKVDKVAAATTYAPLLSMPSTVRHGGTRDTARPDGGPVTWIGWVRPDNMQIQDLWLELERPPFTIKGSVNWEGLYLAADLKTADGGVVTEWPDSGTKGRNLKRNTGIGGGDAIFKKKVTIFNGKPAVSFADSPMWSEVIPSSSRPQVFTVAMVVRATTLPTQIFAAGTVGTVYRQSTPAAQYVFNPGDGAVEIVGSKTDELAFVLVEFNHTASTGRMNNISAITSTERGGLQKLAQIKLGGWDATAPDAKLDVSFLAVASGLLDTWEKNGLIDWVNTTYALGLIK